MALIAQIDVVNGPPTIVVQDIDEIGAATGDPVALIATNYGVFGWDNDLVEHGFRRTSYWSRVDHGVNAEVEKAA